MKLLPMVLLAFATPHTSAQFLHCSPNTIILPIDLGNDLSVDDGGGGHLRFKYAGVDPIFNGTPNFIVVVPSSGTTPAAVQIGLNPTVTAQLKPGSTYSLGVRFTTVDLSPASTAACIVHFIMPKEPSPGIQSVVNAASLQPFLSPGAEVSIIGSHLTGPTLSTNYDDTASYPISVAGTNVTFNGIAAPLLHLSPGKIKAIVPFALAGQTSVQVVVQRFDQASDTFTLPLQDTSPGIFTASHSGTGQGAILQQGSDGQFTYNSADNPATVETKLEIFATGAGVWTPPAQSDVFLFGESFTTQPVSLTIGGQPATVLYAGTVGTCQKVLGVCQVVPYDATSQTHNKWSVLQVNAVVPDGVGSGAQPVVLTIGENSNSQQQVTVLVQ
jgi:uncharacterized protein (TIGR03437 family)